MRGRALLPVAAAAATLLTACVIGPRYVAPPTPAAAQGPFVSTGGAASADQPLPPDWWRLYDDPVLDRLVGQALAENKDLKVAAANLAYAQALLDEARAGRFPTTQLSAGGPTYARGDSQAAARLPASVSYTAGFNVAYQVDIFGRIRRTIQAARANAEALRAAEDVVRVTVAGETASAYASACGLGEQLEVAQSSLTIVQETYDLTVVQRNAGALSDFDVDRQAILLAQAKAAVPPLEGQRRAALFTLAALIGKTPAEIPADAAACHAPPRLTRPLPVGDGAALIRRRPDVREAERQIAAATARIGVAAADLYPTITLGGGIANAAGTISGLGNISTATYSVGPLLSWSFPNILVARAHVREAGAQASSALASFDSTVLIALRDTEQALTAYAAELDRHVALTAARNAAAEALRLANVQYRAGTVSALDLLTAEASLVGANQALGQSDQALSTDQVAVFQELGGGWQDAPVVAPEPLTRDAGRRR